MRQEHRQLDQRNGGGSLEDKAPDESTGGRNGVVVLIPVGFGGKPQATHNRPLFHVTPFFDSIGNGSALRIQLSNINCGGPPVPRRTTGAKIWIPFWKLVQLLLLAKLHDAQGSMGKGET